MIVVGHCLDLLAAMPSESVDCCVTSPPYWGLRDYGDPGQPWPEVAYRLLPGMPEIVVPARTVALGQEPEPYHYVAHLVAVFREVRRVLKPTGTLWLNIGDSYAAGGKSGKAKDLVGIPWLVAQALRADGWYLRSECIWEKPNCTPESVTDRPTRAHEQVFLLAKAQRYHYDQDAVREPHTDPRVSKNGRGGKNAMRGQAEIRPRGNLLSDTRYYNPLGRNKRTIWRAAVSRDGVGHFAVMPTEIVRPCVLAGCPAGGLVLDPFAGAGTVGLVALAEGRRFLGLEQNPEYAAMAGARIERELARVSPASCAEQRQEENVGCIR
jgi:DNA modification methylase